MSKVRLRCCNRVPLHEIEEYRSDRFDGAMFPTEEWNGTKGTRYHGHEMEEGG